VPASRGWVVGGFGFFFFFGVFLGFFLVCFCVGWVWLGGGGSRVLCSILSLGMRKKEVKS